MNSDHKVIDNLIGKKIKARRNQLGLSQAELGKLINVSAQQIQRYESGDNTLSINRLLSLANILNTTSEFFLEDLDHTAQASAQEKMSKGLNRPLRVLLVEDDVNDVILFEKAVAHSNISVQSTLIQRPEEALEQLSHDTHHSHDIVILDINMPRINGIELLKRIKSSQRKFLPVIMLTNSIRKKEMLECYEAGASGFVQKSTDLHEYYDDVARILSYWSELVILPAKALADT